MRLPNPCTLTQARNIIMCGLANYFVYDGIASDWAYTVTVNGNIHRHIKGGIAITNDPLMRAVLAVPLWKSGKYWRVCINRLEVK